MRWEADVKVAGPVGAMGMRVLQPIVNQQVKNVLAALDVQVQEAKAAGAAPPPAAAPAEEGAEGLDGAEEGLSPWSPSPTPATPTARPRPPRAVCHTPRDGVAPRRPQRRRDVPLAGGAADAVPVLPALRSVV